jgi:hypothetical protein
MSTVGDDVIASGEVDVASGARTGKLMHNGGPVVLRVDKYK